MQQPYDGNSYLFSLPKAQSSVSISELCCSQDEDPSDENLVSGVPTPPVMVSDSSQASDAPFPSVIAKGKGSNRGISESELRRSPRIHDQNKGFKPSSCKNRNYLGCESKPPLISSSIVRELGTSFCKLKPSELIDEQLMAKPTKKRAVGRPRKSKDVSAASPMGPEDDGQGGSAAGPIKDK